MEEKPGLLENGIRLDCHEEKLKPYYRNKISFQLAFV